MSQTKDLSDELDRCMWDNLEKFSCADEMVKS